MAHTLTHAAAAVIALTMMGMSSRVGAAETTQCGPADKMLKGLQEQDGEVPAISGALSSGTPFTITVSPKGTFTVLIALNGMLCVGNSGDHWQTVEAPAAKPSPGSLPEAPALLPNGLRVISTKDVGVIW